MTISLPPSARELLRQHVPDPDVQEVVAHAVGAVRLTLDKVLAHQTMKSTYVLPAGADTLEQRLNTAVAALPTDVRQQLAARAHSRLRASVGTRLDTYGNAGQLAPTDAAPVMRAARTLPITPQLRQHIERATFKLRPPTESARVAARTAPDPDDPVLGPPDEPAPEPSPPPPPPPPGALVPSSLRLVVSRVKVINKQEPLPVFKDNIALGAVILDPVSGDSRRIGPIELGTFVSGADLPMRRFVADLPIAAGANLGQFFLANMFLAETDAGGFSSYLHDTQSLLGREALTLATVEAATLVGSTIGGAEGLLAGIAVGVASGASPLAAAAFGLVGTKLVGVIGGAIAAVAALIVTQIADLLAQLFEDDIFAPEALGQTVDPDGRLAFPARDSVIFTRDDAAYEVTFNWEVRFAPGTPAPPLPPPFGRIPRITDPSTADNNLHKVDHIVVLMLENRSFDHMLGYLTRDRGRADVAGLTGAEYNVDSRTGQRIFVRPFSDTTLPHDPPHSHGSVLAQMGIDATHPEPRMTGFVDQYTRVDTGFDDALDDPEDVMGYHPAAHVPVYDFIAREFAICERWFCSFPGNTWVNRTIALAGKPAFGRDGDPTKPFIGNEKLILEGRSEPSFFRHLDAFNDTLRPGETPVEWYSYAQDFSSVYVVDSDHVSPFGSPRVRFMSEFFEDLERGELPQVSWLDPNYVDLGNITDAEFGRDGLVFPRTANDDHPPTDIASAQAMIASLVFAMMRSPLWGKLLFVITYDEHGGMFDHVPPPPNPTPEAEQFKFFGPRVPALVVSPFVERGAVCTENFDHTSLIKTILTRFTRRDGGIPSVSPRVDNATHLGHVLTRAVPRFVNLSAATTTAIALPPPLPVATRNEVLSGLGRRLIVADQRPRVARPATDLEKDIAEVQAFVRAGGQGAAAD